MNLQSWNPRNMIVSSAVTAVILLQGCSPDFTGEPQEPTWQLVQEQLPAALLSVSGTSQNDVYTVGADPGDGMGPFVLHFDGNDWQRLESGATGDLWWISDRLINNDFWLAGENGLILRFDPDAGTFDRQQTPGTELLFGIWGANSTNIWAVGGNPEELENNIGGVIWFYNGANWSVVDLSLIAPNGIPALYKVWGRSVDEVYACGANGVILRFDGTNWLRVDTDTTRRLFTIHGNDTLITAVGGFGSGVIEEYDGFSFNDVADALTPQLNGVYLNADNFGVGVGNGASVVFRGEDGEWVAQTTGLQTARDFHGAWVDPNGGVWAVGGNVASDPLIDGIVAYFGERNVATGLGD